MSETSPWYDLRDQIAELAETVNTGLDHPANIRRLLVPELERMLTAMQATAARMRAEHTDPALTERTPR